MKAISGDTLNNSHYVLEADTCPDGGSGTLSIADCVRVKAIPRKTDTAVGTLSLTSTGAKACTGTAASTNLKLCWP